MIGRMGFAALLGAGCLALAANAADAGSRVRLNFYPSDPSYDTYYPGPLYIPAPRYYYYELQPRRPMRWDPALRRRTARNVYEYDPNDPYYSYDQDYYEPEVVPPPRKKKLTLPSSKKPAKKLVTKDAAKTEKKTGSMSCDRATEIVTGYGFSGVKAMSCKGSVYSFAAARDGKPYTVKLSAASGELTEVKKVK